MKKILNLICALSILGLSTSQVLSCNHKTPLPTPSSNTKSDLSKSDYYENSTADKSSLAIHGLQSGDSIQNLKTAIYQYILKKYNSSNAAKKAITLADVKKDLSLKIFDTVTKAEISSVQDFTKYSVLISAKKDAKYFSGSNKKENFTVDLTQLDLSKFKLKKISFTNTKTKGIKSSIETEISKWYNDQEKSITHSVPEAITSAEVDRNLDITIKNSSANSAEQLSATYKTKNFNEEYFFDQSGTFSNKITDYFGADFNDLKLDQVNIATDGLGVYRQVYAQAAALVNSSLKKAAHKVTPEDIKNDKNLKLSIFYTDKGKKINIDKLKSGFASKTLHLKVNINQKDKYFLPWNQKGSKQFKLSIITLDNLNYHNYDITNASRFEYLKAQTVTKLAQSYNQIFKTHITGTDVWKTKPTWTFYSKTKHKVIPEYYVPDYNDEYTISLGIGKHNPYFGNLKNSKKESKIANFTLNTNDLRTHLNINNIKTLTSSKDLFHQLDQSMVNEYNRYYQGKRKPITVADLNKDGRQFSIAITDCFTKRDLNSKDVTNSLKIRNHYRIQITVIFNNIHFRWTHRPIILDLYVHKLNKINTKFFDLSSQKYHFKKISQVKSYLYTKLAQDYNSKLNAKTAKISAQTLMKDKHLHIKITNSGMKKTGEINYNSNIQYYLTTTNNDQYFGQFTNLKLGQFSYQEKIDLGTKQAQNYINNEEKFAWNNTWISKADVIGWFMKYVNSTKQFSKKLTWSMVAPYKDSVQVKYLAYIYMIDKPTPTFTITVHNSPYLKAGKFTFLEKNFKFNTATISKAVPALQHAHWAYNDLWYHVYRTPTIADATNYIGFFELRRIYAALNLQAGTSSIDLSNKLLSGWIKKGIIKILWTKNNDGKYLSSNYKITGYGPTHYQMFIIVEKSNQIFSIWTKPVKLLDVFFTTYTYS